MKEQNLLTELRNQIIGYRNQIGDAYSTVEPVYELQYRSRLCKPGDHGDLLVSVGWSDWRSVTVEDAHDAHDHSQFVPSTGR